MGLAESVILPQVCDLFWILPVSDLLHLVKPIGHWQTVFLHNGREVGRPVGIAAGHGH